MREARRLVFAAMLVVAAMLVMLMPAYARAATDDKGSDLVASSDSQLETSTVIPEYQTIDELAGKTVGTGAGGVFDQLVRENAPEITDFKYYETYADMVAALKAKRIDAFLMDKPVCELLVSRNTGITLLPESLVDDDYGFALTKNSPLTEKLNKVIEQFWADGTIEALHDKWMGADEDAKTMPEMDWDASAGTLRVALDNTIEPLAYMRDSEIVGYDAELVMLCAKELGMGVEFSSMTFVAMLSSVQSGKADVGVGCISITDERRQKMDLTVPTYYGAATFVVRDVGDSEQASSSFAEDFAASFERTFIVENRWKLIVAGLGVTVLITLLSSAAGTALGFITVLLRRRGNRVASMLVHAFEGLMGRLPIVVVLMVFYYVVFGTIDISSIAVAILVFTLAFGASAGSIMWNAVQAVDVGQSEASLALGFTENQTFFGVVLPQAARRFLPLLSGQLVSLAKDTSVVGYIAVQDLTRVGDLIRSRTMEAFFPLLTTAAIYFALCCVLAEIVSILIRRLDLERRPRAIKGVEL